MILDRTTSFYRESRIQRISWVLATMMWLLAPPVIADISSVNASEVAALVAATTGGLGAGATDTGSARPIRVNQSGIAVRGLSAGKGRSRAGRSSRISTRARASGSYRGVVPIYRGGGTTRITILANQPRVVTVNAVRRPDERALANGLCRESATRLCITPSADFRSVELFCGARGHRFPTVEVGQPVYLGCPEGRISSIWVEKRGMPGIAEGGSALQVDPPACPLTSPCRTVFKQ